MILTEILRELGSEPWLSKGLPQAFGDGAIARSCQLLDGMRQSGHALLAQMEQLLGARQAAGPQGNSGAASFEGDSTAPGLPHLKASGALAFPPAARDILTGLKPWRKGPFMFGDVYVDTEWRSDWKWDRIAGQIAPLAGRRVLDVGCGSGYHLWRMLLEGADLGVGVEPFLVSTAQFYLCRGLVGSPPPRVGVLPLTLEELPPNSQCFDTVFSMGVLYHQRSPFDHLFQLKAALAPQGELVLETLIIPQEYGQILVPRDRYAKMRNVWFIPSLDELLHWVRRAGFVREAVLDITPTTLQEQRSTPWMTFESLEDFLDPQDPSRTVEGYPAPLRASLRAERN